MGRGGEVEGGDFYPCDPHTTTHHIFLLFQDHAEIQLALRVLRRVEAEIHSHSGKAPVISSSPPPLLMVSTPPCPPPSTPPYPVSILGSTEDEDNPFRRQQGCVWREREGGGTLGSEGVGEQGSATASEEEGGSCDSEEDLLSTPLVEKALYSNVALRSIHSKKSLAKVIEGLCSSGALVV